jgi:hypothetical protein
MPENAAPLECRGPKASPALPDRLGRRARGVPQAWPELRVPKASLALPDRLGRRASLGLPDRLDRRARGVWQGQPDRLDPARI